MVVVIVRALTDLRTPERLRGQLVGADGWKQSYCYINACGSPYLDTRTGGMHICVHTEEKPISYSGICIASEYRKRGALISEAHLYR